MAWSVIGGHRNNFIILRIKTLKDFFHTEALTLTVQSYVSASPLCFVFKIGIMKTYLVSSTTIIFFLIVVLDTK